MGWSAVTGRVYTYGGVYAPSEEAHKAAVLHLLSLGAALTPAGVAQHSDLSSREAADAINELRQDGLLVHVTDGYALPGFAQHHQPMPSSTELRQLIVDVLADAIPRSSAAIAEALGLERRHLSNALALLGRTPGDHPRHIVRRKDGEYLPATTRVCELHRVAGCCWGVLPSAWALREGESRAPRPRTTRSVHA